MNTPAHLVFDRALLRARLARAHAQGAAGFLVDNVACDFADRLSAVLRPFPRILDLGTPTQALATLMSARAPEKLVRTASVAAALGEGPWTGMVVDEEALPFSENGFDLVVSALALQFVKICPVRSFKSAARWRPMVSSLVV